MHIQKLYGSSDDLVGLSGDVDDEIGGGSKPTYVRFSTGTYAKIHYGDEGIWRIEVLDAGKGKIKKLFGLPDNIDGECNQYHNDNDAPCYSDVLIIESEEPITLEEYGKQKLKPNCPHRIKAREIIDVLNGEGWFNDQWSDLQDDERNSVIDDLVAFLKKP